VALVEIRADLSRLVNVLERLTTVLERSAAALDRAYPAKISPPFVSKAYKPSLKIHTEEEQFLADIKKQQAEGVSTDG
jgi:hypothetical protein